MEIFIMLNAILDLTRGLFDLTRRPAPPLPLDDSVNQTAENGGFVVSGAPQSDNHKKADE
ncbi:hypothetical protein M2371_004289 [Buttiauxella sp. BIGb0471]|uniref:hypothetical protein n=1 Tax=Buttiauxella sp. BIGb0471 TaxID=2940597 RepID=UPI002167BD1A|nr:hypothetical protein [Buttiauxella sp. BIGb0471]MCS3605035.1 hypothetical protein [Buttiauxella sp. BIGb0471]